MSDLIEDKKRATEQLYRETLNNDPSVVGFYEPGSADPLGRTQPYALLKGGTKDENGKPISWRYLNNDEKAYQESLRELRELEGSVDNEADRRKKDPTYDNKDFDDVKDGKSTNRDNDVGQQCATCKAGACSCIHKITITPENQKEIQWKQQGLMRRILLMDKGKGAKLNVKLGSVQKSVSFL